MAQFDKISAPKNAVHLFNVDIDIAHLLQQWIKSKVPDEVDQENDTLYKLAEVYLRYLHMVDRPPDFDGKLIDFLGFKSRL